MTITDVGAVCYGNATGGTVGWISSNNSVRGTGAGGGAWLNYAFDSVNNQLIVVHSLDNIVTLFKPTPTAKSNERIRIIL